MTTTDLFENERPDLQYFYGALQGMDVLLSCFRERGSGNGRGRERIEDLSLTQLPACYPWLNPSLVPSSLPHHEATPHAVVIHSFLRDSLRVSESEIDTLRLGRSSDPFHPH